MDLHLDDRVAVVTGGASGIGRACVQALSAEGARVVIIDRSPTGPSIAKEEQRRGRTVKFVHANVAVEEDVREAIANTIAAYGHIDTVLGCAGISGPVGTPAAQVSVDEWDQVMAVNVRGNFLLAKHTIPHLQRSEVATLVFLASDSAVAAFDGMAPYCTSKAAVVMLAKALSVDHPEIRVNALCPGIVDTPMSRTDLGYPDGFTGSALPVIPAHQIAMQAVFLASPVSAPINGATVIADLGYHARSAVGTLSFTTRSDSR